MTNPIGYGVFGTFGGPYGYQQVFYNSVQFYDSLNLDNNAIQLYPGSELYAVRRVFDDGVYTVCFCIYSSAKETNNEVGATFIGSCMVLQDGYAEAEYIYNTLREFHDSILNNEQNFKAQQVQDIVTYEPPSFVALKANVIPINKTPFASSGVDAGKQLLVIPGIHNTGDTAEQVIAFFDRALKAYSDTGTLYFSLDYNVSDFVREQAAIGIKAWSDFFNYLPIESNRYVIASSEKIGSGQQYDTFSAKGITGQDDYEDANKPFDLWEGPVPPNGWAPEEVAYKMKEYNRLFKYTNTLLEHINEPNNKKSKRHKNDPEKTNNVKMALIFLGIMLLVAAAMYFNEEEDTPRVISEAPVQSPIQESVDDATQNGNDTVVAAPAAIPGNEEPASSVTAAQPSEEEEEIIPEQSSTGPEQYTPEETSDPTSIAETAQKELPQYLNTKELRPRPNFELTQNDIVALRQSGVKNKTLREIAKLLYDNVPSNIGNIYKGQEAEYAATLLNNNRQTFQQAGADYICTADDIMLHIPAYKSPRLPILAPR